MITYETPRTHSLGPLKDDEKVAEVKGAFSTWHVYAMADDWPNGAGVAYFVIDQDGRLCATTWDAPSPADRSDLQSLAFMAALAYAGARAGAEVQAL